MSSPRNGQLRFYWAQWADRPKFFYEEVESFDEAVTLYQAFAGYDQFLEAEGFLSKSGSSFGGLEVFEDGEWLEWENGDGDDMREVIDNADQ